MKHTLNICVCCGKKENPTNLKIIDRPHAFIGMFMSLEMDVDAVLVQQIFHTKRMHHWDPNTDLSIQHTDFAFTLTLYLACT